MVSMKSVAASASASLGTVSNVLNRPEKVAAQTAERVLRAIADLSFVRNGAARRAHGVLVTPVSDHLSFRQLADRGIPVVLVDGDGFGRAVSSVSVDDVEGAKIAVNHLLDRKCGRIAFVGGKEVTRQVRDRYAGALQAVSAANTATLEHIETKELTVEAGRGAGREIVARRVAKRPDGVFANDLVALGLMQALVMTGGARVPNEIALVGYSDIDFGPSAVVPLSSIRQPATLIGRTAVDLLLDHARPRQVRLRPELVQRASALGWLAPSDRRLHRRNHVQ